MQQTERKPLFDLGQLVATPGALAALEKSGQNLTITHTGTPFEVLEAPCAELYEMGPLNGGSYHLDWKEVMNFPVPQLELIVSLDFSVVEPGPVAVLTVSRMSLTVLTILLSLCAVMGLRKIGEDD